MNSSKDNTNANSSEISHESENIDDDIPSAHQVCVLVANISLSDSNFLETIRSRYDRTCGLNNVFKQFNRMRNPWMGLCRMQRVPIGFDLT